MPDPAKPTDWELDVLTISFGEFDRLYMESETLDEFLERWQERIQQATDKSTACPTP